MPRIIPPELKPGEKTTDLMAFLFRYENALCQCGIDPTNVDYDKLSDVRGEFTEELEKMIGHK